MSISVILYRDFIYAIHKSIVYKADKQGSYWTKDYTLFDDGLDRALVLSISNVDPNGKSVLLVLNAERDVRLDNDWQDAWAIKNCSCDIRMIFTQGCQCGGA